MSTLKLVTTETFNNLSCSFYRNMNDDILLTREQIGQALEYSDPAKAIRNIHLKYKERLETLCVRIKEPTLINSQCNNMKNLLTEKVYYTLEGALIICSLSYQPKAYDFSKWLLKISSSNNIKIIKTRSENDFMILLKDFLDEYQISYIPQYKYENYRIDLYLPDLKFAIEYDENDHKDYTYKQQEYREEYLTKQLSCKFIRLSDHVSDGRNIAIVSKYFDKAS